MRLSRLFLALLLFAACAALPAKWATAQDEKKPDDKKSTKTATGDADTEKALAELKKALETTQKDLATATKTLETLKAAAEGDSKKVEAITKELDALKTSAKGALTKADLTAISAKADALAKQVDGLKAGDPKTGEKLAAIEKAAEEIKKTAEKGVSDAASGTTTGKQRGDSAWMLVSSAFVMFMVPGLALFYCGMVRRKNVLSTMMHSMAALAVVGVYWIAIGYSLAFGPSAITVPDGIAGLFGEAAKGGGFIGFSSDLLFLKGVEPGTYLGGYDIPVYVHVMFQGMFAIITPALISGAIAERIRFWPFCIFMILWVTFVYCPLAHMVWAFDWFDTSVVAAKRGATAIGLLGKMGALDFAGGTVVHIAAGMAGLACCIVIGKRAGYPQQVAHPNSMVLTLLGAGLLWFGWFGFNGGSSLRADGLAGSAFAATQAAAAAAGLVWMLIEWLHKGKPTALGLASGIVAGLVAVTPASGFVYMWGGALIGVIAAIVCYLAVALKNVLGYDDSLDAFGVHGVGGFVGAILTGVFCSTLVNNYADGPFAYSAHRARLEELKKDDGKLIKDAKGDAEKAGKAFEEAEKKANEATGDAKKDADKAKADAEDQKKDKEATASALEAELAQLQGIADKQDDIANDGKDKKTGMSQVYIQTKASVFSVIYAFVLSLVLCILTQLLTLGNFKTDEKGEADGLDRTEHGEVGFDFSAATESVTVVSAEPRAATAPKGNGRYEVTLTGADSAELMRVWTDLCQPTEGAPDADFLAVYPYVTTVRGTTFRCRGGDPAATAKRLEKLFTRLTGKPVSAKA